MNATLPPQCRVLSVAAEHIGGDIVVAIHLHQAAVFHFAFAPALIDTLTLRLAQIREAAQPSTPASAS